jgi:diguanylate cyclase (GGDEF)-like protein/PAS domain S-box-containing protein
MVDAAKLAFDTTSTEDIRILRRKWQAAAGPRGELPPFEEVVLGSLGRLADHLILVGGDSLDSLHMMRAGRRIQEWIGSDIRGKLVKDLPADRAILLAEVLSQALKTCEVIQSITHRVRDGLVETCDVVALPMSCRWGGNLVTVYIGEPRTRYNLVDRIYSATDEGILAFAAIRDSVGHPIDFQLVALNEGASRLLGKPERELLWRRVSEIQRGLAPPDKVDRLLSALKSGQRDQFEITVVVHGGCDVHLKVGVATIGDLVSVTLTDIGELREREASFRLLFDGNPVPMWLYDPDSLKFISVNEAAISHYGYSRDQFHEMTLLDIWPPDERHLHESVVRTDAYQSNRTWRHIKADGSEIEVLTYARTLSFDQSPAAMVAVVDVTERKQAEARIAHMAHHDALTGLPNRVLFHERLNESLARLGRQSGGLAIHCLDLDQFKSVNDTLGHPVGDLLLRAVAERLGRCMRANDLVARLGGDEFAIIQTGVSGPHEAGGFASQLIDIVSQPYEIQGHDVIVGGSIGIAMAPGDGEVSDALLRNADMALYRAKSDGRGIFHFFAAEMDRRIQSRRALELELRKAFTSGEFELFYQPLINLHSDEISGFEALLRWRHPERGLVSPAEFIPLAEDTGMIIPIGEWVLRQACAEARNWPRGVKVAVNLSSVQFRGRGLVQAVMSALAHSRLAPSRLELEITESVLLRETEANLATLHQLRALGARISMDDFGTGYSSLSYLRSFPFDKIKIDKSFVSDLADRPDCLAIVRAVTGLAASLGVTTTAEGVETQQQLDCLRAEGCAEGQGNWFGPPRPAADVIRMIAGRGAVAKIA